MKKRTSADRQSTAAKTARGVARWQTPRVLAPLVLGAVTLVAAACGGHQAMSGSDEEIVECSAYVAALRACAGKLGSSEIAEARAEAMRAQLHVQASDDKKRPALARSCSAASARLAQSCH